MLVEIAPEFKKFLGITFQTGHREVRELGVNDRVILSEGIDDASSDETTEIARVEPLGVRLEYSWGGGHFVSGDIIPTSQVNYDPRTRDRIRVR